LSGPEFIGSDLRLEAPAMISKMLLNAGLEDKSFAVETIEVAALNRRHPQGLELGLLTLKSLLYPGGQLQPRVVTQVEGAEKDILAAYEKYKAGHMRQMAFLSDQANHFLEEHPNSLIFMGEEGWEPITEVAVSQPDERWNHAPELYARAAGQPVSLCQGQLQCNRAALGPEVELLLAALPQESEA
jgi:hypothetical protein